MRFYFSAPFRTDINLNSIEAARFPGSVEERLRLTEKAMVPHMAEGMQWAVPKPHDSEAVRLYSSIGEDSIPSIAMPLAQLRLTDKAVKLLLESHRSGLGAAIGQISVVDCVISFFDNTIAILTLDVTISPKKEAVTVFDDIESWSNQVCYCIIKLTKKYETMFLSILHSRPNGKAKKIFLRPGNFVVYSDRNDARKSNDSGGDDALWVSRIFFGGNDANLEVLKQWTQNPQLKENPIDVSHAQIDLCVGNSVVFGRMSQDEEESLKKALSICTNFFVLYVVLDKNLKEEYLRVSNDRSISSITISRTSRTRNHIEFIESEFSDTRMGLQGQRKAFATRLLEVWSFSDLDKSISRKKGLIEKYIEFALLEKHGLHRRILESILAAIAGVAVLEFVLVLFSFAADGDMAKDSVVGLVDAVKYLSVDAILYLIFGFIIFLVYLTGRKR